MMPRREYLCPLLAMLAGAVGLPARAGGAPPIAEYRFNGSGTSATSTGSDPTPVSFFDSTNMPASLYGPGVSGLSGDFAFDNRASTAMGTPGPGGHADQAADNAATDGLKSFTIQGWFKTDGTQAIGRDAALINNLGTGGGWSLRGQGLTGSGNVGNLTLLVNSTEAYSGPGVNFSGPYNATQTWVFFAVSYDGTTSTNNVKFYQGSATIAVTLVATRSLAAGPAGDDDNSLKVGNAAATGVVTKPFDGLLDDVRLFGSATDGSGVLDQPQLESFRSGDAQNTPEPAAGSGFMLLAVSALGIRRKRAGRPSQRRIRQRSA